MPYRSPATLPLSPGQRGLWFLHRLHPEGSAYHLALASRIVGEIPTAEISELFQAQVDRHEALRTTFPLEGEEPVQRVADRAELAFEEIDARCWDEAAFLSRLEEEAWKPFDLENGPLFRVQVFHRNGERVLLVVAHHIVVDFGSFAAMLAGGGEARQYRDFLRWQDDEDLWSFWRDRLADLPLPELPTDRPRRGSVPERGGCRWREIDPGVVRQLKALARSHGGTLYVALLAGFQALLSRFTGQIDFAVGSPAAGRPKGFARTMGYFTNPLPVRADLSGDPSFSELLGRTRGRVSEALDHQHLPLPVIVERLRAEGREGDLFRTLFVFHRDPSGLDGMVGFALGEGGGRLRWGGLELEPLPLPPRAAQFDVTLAAGERRGSLGLQIVYDADLLEGSTAARWLEHLAMLLEGAAAHPDVSITELPLLTLWERQQVLVEVNDRGNVAPPWSRLEEGFERQANRTPEAVALIDGERRVTYRELRDRATALAEHLSHLSGRVVGVKTPRTADMVASLLGVLKAGATYLPLDPSYPEERINFLLEDAGASYVLQGTNDVPPLPVEGGRWERGPGGEVAYLIYTSGSTGRPKGVAIEHRSAVRLVAWALETFSREELDGVLASTSISFDLSIFEIFAPLSCGGTAILAENALALPTLPAAGEVTLINTVPSAMAALLDLGPLPPSVKTVNLAGEPLRRSLAQRVLATGVRLWDLYGPSEDTTYSTGAEVRASDPGEPAIGWPVAGSRAYVLDAHLQPLPVGVPGELCLGGDGLARGYLSRPELTAEKFVPDPFSGGRLYRTGDLARRWPDGALEYLGRMDHQVKIRGFRIEPGEIEAALLSHPGVRQAVVVARDGALVAYVSLSARIEGELASYLRSRLPAAFVPSDFVVLPALPLTPNGKVDRKALPAPRSRGDATEGPAGPVEELLAGIWAEVLGRERIGRHQSFFDLGGHSLLATRVAVRIREALGVEIPLSTVFDEPTLAGLARRLETLQRGGPVTPIPHARRDLPLPLSYAQQGLWFLDRLEPGTATYNIPLEIRLTGRLSIPALETAIAGIERRHEALRTAFPEVEGRPVQRIAQPSRRALPCIDLAGLPLGEEEAGRLAREEARRPFDLNKGPLIRTTLVRLGAEEHRLHFSVHHAIFDGGSIGILLRELAALYEGSSLPDLPVQLADVAVWERNLLDAGALEPQLAWWESRLAGLPPLDLPADRPRPAVPTQRGGLRRMELPAGLAREVTALARRERATPFMILLAAFQALLGRLAGQDDLAAGTPVSRRGRAELEPLIGLLLNTVAVRVSLAGEPTFRAFLGAVRTASLEAFRHADVPFEKIVERLQPDRAGRNPLFQVLFTLEPPIPRRIELPDLILEPHGHPTGTAKFDLSLFLREAAGGRLTAELEHSLDLFDGSTADRLLRSFATLLEAVVADPDARVSDLLLLEGAERRQLLAEAKPRGEAVFVPPRGPVEEALAGLWVELLDAEQIGAHDDFFALGGHSLLAVQVVSRVRAAFGVELPLRTVFQAPTIAGLATAIEAARTETEPAPPLVRVPRDGGLPLTFAQQRLWFLHQLDPGSAAYHMAGSLELRGVSLPALETALREIARRHEALRTTFTLEGESPVQVIAAEPELELPEVDLAGLPDPRAEAARIETAEARRSFDLGRGPLLRVRLLRLGPDEHRLAVVMHHIVADGWSLGVMLRELGQLYAGSPTLPELPVQVADYAVWQRRWLQGEALQSRLSWWEGELAGADPSLPLPTDRPRPVGAASRSAILHFSLPTAPRTRGATLFMTLLAGWNALLYRYSGRRDLSVGSPVANRDRIETEGLIGFFVNTLVLRTRLDGSLSFGDLLERLKEGALGAYDHQDLPFEKLVEELRPDRGTPQTSPTPLFQVFLALQNAPRPRLELPGLTARLEPVETGAPKTDLTLDFQQEGEELAGSLEYRTDLFDAATMARLARHLERLLAGAAADPKARLALLPLLSDVEREQLLVAWNPAPEGPPPGPCLLHEHFEVWAERTPDAPAVLFESDQLTYRELDCWANRLAHHLIAQGLAPGARVGLWLERSVEVIVGILGALKAGAAWVPLDPAYPLERLAYMARDAGLSALLTTEAMAEALGTLTAELPEGAVRVLLDADRRAIEARPDASPRLRLPGNSLAYVLYTSGSTGRPKGVCCHHAGVLNFLEDLTRLNPLPPGTRASLWTSLTFDVSVHDIFSPLVSGGTVDIVPDRVRPDGRAYTEWLAERGIENAYVAPAMQAQLLETLQRTAIPLKRLIAGVEPLPEPLLAAIATCCPGLSVLNGYGPTETTIVVTEYPVVVEPGYDPPDRNAPIGKPIRNTRVYLLDEDLELVPAGVPGGLYAAGDPVSWGYLGRPDMTAERFLPDPFSRVPGERMYRTGDLARWLPDGNLVFLGRIDQQVKIRGIRVEPGEIEAALRDHLEVRDATVAPRSAPDGERRLVAWVVGEASPGALRDFLRTRLPEVMVPSAFLPLDALPLTANGKVNRAALPDPDWQRPDLRGGYVAPRTLVEEMLADLWKDLLGVERVGIHDSFFDLGGHSLKAGQLALRVRDLFEVELPVRAVFEAPTVADMAVAIGRRMVEEADPEALREVLAEVEP